MRKIHLKLLRVAILVGVLMVVLLTGYLIHGKLFYKGSQAKDFKVQPLGQGFSLAGDSFNSSEANKLATYPPPEQFRKFESQDGALHIYSTCEDKYYVVLVFEKDIDYRKNPRAARYNRAFLCPVEKRFNLTIESSELNGSGMYYYIVADENDTEEWYNPR